jgi:hypothetical protein
MSLITSDIGAEGALVEVVVDVFAARRNLLTQRGRNVPPPLTIRAQIDTGAYCSGFDHRVFVSLDLGEQFDEKPILTPSTDDEPHPAPVYFVSLTLRADRGGTDRRFEAIRVLAHTFGEDEQAQGLIGRDILDLCYFAYDGLSRRFLLSF